MSLLFACAKLCWTFKLICPKKSIGFDAVLQDPWSGSLDGGKLNHDHRRVFFFSGLCTSSVLPLVHPGGRIVWTLKFFGKGAKHREKLQNVTQELRGEVENIEFVGLLANTQSEITMMCTRAGTSNDGDKTQFSHSPPTQRQCL